MFVSYIFDSFNASSLRGGFPLCFAASLKKLQIRTDAKKKTKEESAHNTEEEQSFRFYLLRMLSTVKVKKKKVTKRDAIY